MIDELAALIAYADPDTRRDAGRLLSEVLTQGRALGVVVVAMVQDPRKETVGQRGLFTQTVALRLRSAEETRMVLGDGMAARGAGASDQPGRARHRVRRRRRRHRRPGPRALVERPAGPPGRRHLPGPRRAATVTPNRTATPVEFAAPVPIAARPRKPRSPRTPRTGGGGRARRRGVTMTGVDPRWRVAGLGAAARPGRTCRGPPTPPTSPPTRRSEMRDGVPGAARWSQACAAAAGEWQVTAGWWAGAHREADRAGRSRHQSRRGCR